MFNKVWQPWYKLGFLMKDRFFFAKKSWKNYVLMTNFEKRFDD